MVRTSTTPNGRPLGTLRRGLALVLLLAAVPNARPSGVSAVEVRRGGDGLLAIRVEGAPLVEVLERLSQQAGFRVVYDGAKPSQRVTVDLTGLTDADAVRRLLEGLGLNYVLQTDASGTHASVLVLTEAKASIGARPSTPSRFEPPPPPDPVETFDEEPPIPPEALATEQPPEAAAVEAPDGPTTTPGVPGGHPAFPTSGPVLKPPLLPFFPPGASLPR